MSYVIVGLGQTGFSVARHLQRQNLLFVACDTRKNPSGLIEFQTEFPDAPIFCGDLPADLLKQAQQIILSPGVALATPEIAAAQAAGVEVVGDVELFLRQISAPVLAITGSNGKTTVTTLVGEMARASGLRTAVAGNIGQSVLDLLDTPYDLYVLELSSFQLETTYSLHALAAVSLNVSDNHMDRYDTFADYIVAKNRIYQHAQVCVINLDDPPAWETISLSQNCIGFTVNDSTTSQALQSHFTLQNGALCCDNVPWVNVSELAIQTKHHLANTLAAFALGHVAGLQQAAMVAVAKSFQGIAHRCQKIFEHQGISWINDSKGTTVAATRVAIENIGKLLSGKIILIAGGDGKGADFSPLTKLIEGYCRAVLLMGRDADKIAAILPEAVPSVRVSNMAQAVKQAAQLAQAGDVVLLSPACASIDMFKNYIERGEQFTQAARSLTNV
jgi:UDP-N-acetylmuramoylalanine--D-glutamate ligase